MKKNIINLKKPEHAYFFGFAQTDGSLYQNRNSLKFSIEIHKRDEYILYEFKKLFPSIFYNKISWRIRTLKSGNTSHMVCLNTSINSFTNNLNKIGIPCGKKHMLIAPPQSKFIEIDYIRGLFDGDGSLGFMKTGRCLPFLAITTSSEFIKNYLLNFFAKELGKIKKLNRNTKDKTYKIVLYGDDAKQIIKLLYYKNCLSLPRKYKLAEQIINWVKPKNMRDLKRWSEYENDFIMNNSFEKCIKYLIPRRTYKAIENQYWRLLGVWPHI